MKHCLIITAYKDICQLNKLIETAPPDFGIYVHIDLKSKIRISEVSSRANVYKKYKINWGCFEHLRAFLDLLEEAWMDKRQYDYFHLITGQDFYAVSPLIFDQILGMDRRACFIEVHPFPRKGWWGGGYDILRYRSLSSYLEVQRNKFGKLLEKCFISLQKLVHVQRSLPPYSLYGGSVYCSLGREGVAVCLNSELASDLQRRLKNSKCGEEVYFQTVLMNSDVKDYVVNDYHRYIDWTGKNPPQYLKEKDYLDVIHSGNLFCRKVDSEISGKLIEKILQSFTHENF